MDASLPVGPSGPDLSTVNRIHRASLGDRAALGELLEGYRPRLRSQSGARRLAYLLESVAAEPATAEASAAPQ